VSYRPLKPSEHHACFVGSGECIIPAAFATDDGAGVEVYVCALHREHFEFWEGVFSQLSPGEFKKAEAAIMKAQQPPGTVNNPLTSDEREKMNRMVKGEQDPTN
jgi:hypothetical protein